MQIPFVSGTFLLKQASEYIKPEATHLQHLSCIVEPIEACLSALSLSLKNIHIVATDLKKQCLSLMNRMLAFNLSKLTFIKVKIERLRDEINAGASQV